MRSVAGGTLREYDALAHADGDSGPAAADWIPVPGQSDHPAAELGDPAHRERQNHPAA
jgi:hypothetical protein